MSKKNKSDNEDFFMDTSGEQISMIAEISTDGEAEEVKMNLTRKFQ